MNYTYGSRVSQYQLTCFYNFPYSFLDIPVTFSFKYLLSLEGDKVTALKEFDATLSIIDMNRIFDIIDY